MPTLTIEQALAHALDRHRAGGLAEAEKVYRQILAQQPRHADALHLLGMLLHQTGRRELAIGSLEQAIAVSPGQAVFHSNLGLVLAAGGKLEPAIAAYHRSLELDPTSAQAMNNLGAALHATGKTDEAVTWLERSLASAPNDADAKNNLAHILMLRGNAAVAAGERKSALRYFERSVALNPTDAEALHGLGSVLHETGRSSAAIEHLRKSLTICPDSAHTHNNLGNALFELGRAQEALECYQRALAINPDFPESSNNLGNVLKSLGRIEEAIAAYSRSVGLQPDRPEPYSNLGNLLREAGQRELAIQSYQAALAIDPDHALTHNNLANAHSEVGEWERAVAEYEHALRTDPEYADAMNNLGTALEELGRRDEARTLYLRALELNPDSVSAPWNIALQDLQRGEYETGWLGYENRWRQKKQKLAFRNFSEPMLPPISSACLGNSSAQLAPLLNDCAPERRGGAEKKLNTDFTKPTIKELDFRVHSSTATHVDSRIFSASPRLCGEKSCQENKKSCDVNEEPDSSREDPALRSTSETGLKGKRVLLHAEQGLGDAIQFCRYAPMVAELGATVLLECEPTLVRLFSTLAGVAEVIPARSPLPAFDFQCPLMSLPMVFGTTLATVPARVPYLSADTDDVRRWGERFVGEPPGLRVGLAWAGGGNHQKDRHRSLKLDDFSILSDISGVNFYSLQLGEPASQAAAPPAGMRLVDWANDLHDFADTAALVSHLDLVITVDTSVGHLAGAMGKPIWTLLAFHPDWRWLLDREDSPWYPRHRLFRQKSPKDWSDPLRALADALRTMVETRRV